MEFVARYLCHVLPRGLKALRHYGFCHPAAAAQRERLAFHTGMPLRVGASVVGLSPFPSPATPPAITLARLLPILPSQTQNA